MAHGGRHRIYQRPVNEVPEIARDADLAEATALCCSGSELSFFEDDYTEYQKSVTLFR